MLFRCIPRPGRVHHLQSPAIFRRHSQCAFQPAGLPDQGIVTHKFGEIVVCDLDGRAVFIDRNIFHPVDSLCPVGLGKLAAHVLLDAVVVPNFALLKDHKIIGMVLTDLGRICFLPKGRQRRLG